MLAFPKTQTVTRGATGGRRGDLAVAIMSSPSPTMNQALARLPSRVAGKPSPVQITHTEAVYNCGALPRSATPAELMNAPAIMG